MGHSWYPAACPRGLSLAPSSTSGLGSPGTERGWGLLLECFKPTRTWGWAPRGTELPAHISQVAVLWSLVPGHLYYKSTRSQYTTCFLPPLQRGLSNNVCLKSYTTSSRPVTQCLSIPNLQQLYPPSVGWAGMQGETATCPVRTKTCLDADGFSPLPVMKLLLQHRSGASSNKPGGS